MIAPVDPRLTVEAGVLGVWGAEGLPAVESEEVDPLLAATTGAA